MASSPELARKVAPIPRYTRPLHFIICRCSRTRAFSFCEFTLSVHYAREGVRCARVRPASYLRQERGCQDVAPAHRYRPIHTARAAAPRTLSRRHRAGVGAPSQHNQARDCGLVRAPAATIAQSWRSCMRGADGRTPSTTRTSRRPIGWALTLGAALTGAPNRLPAGARATCSSRSVTRPFIGRCGRTSRTAACCTHICGRRGSSCEALRRL